MPIKPRRLGNSPKIRGEVTRRKRGVNASMGTEIERSECFKAFIYSIVESTFRDPPTKRAAQNPSPILGIPRTIITGIKNKNAKKRAENATIYSSTILRLFLLATSVKDSKIAVNPAKMNHAMI